MFLQRMRNRGNRMGLLLDRAAARHPENVVILDHDLGIAPRLGRRVTVAELADLVDDLASRLWASKVRTGDYVAVYKTDGFDIPLLAFAAARIGAVPMLLSSKLDGSAVCSLLARAGRPHLVTDQAKLENDLPTSVRDQVSRILLANGSHRDAVELHAMEGVARVSPVILPADHPALVTHTSGTTGIPKLTVHTGWSLQARYRPQSAPVKLVSRRETAVLHISFAHSRAISATATALYNGFPFVVMADDDPDRAGRLFSQLRPGIIETHPNSFVRWEVLTEDPRRPFSNVKYFSSTFDAIHPRTVQRLLRASDRRNPMYVQVYGQSETGPVVARVFTRRRSVDDDGRCVGIPFPGMTRVRVVSRNGAHPTAASPGYIEASTDGRAIGYLGESQRYAQQVNDGWWRMGDLGYRTRWGCIHLLDREVDEIPGFGSTLAAEDKLLARIPELAEVIIIPGVRGEAVPVLATKDDAPIDQQAWRKAIIGLPPMAEPVQRRLDELPHTGTTKVKRLQLAKQLGNGE